MSAKFALRQYVRKIGQSEVRSVEQISQLEPGKETLYSVQLGTDFATREWVKESELESVKPTAEQQKHHTRLSGTLQALGHRHYSELPDGAKSLSLNISNGRVVTEVYDNQGKKIGTVPNDKTSPAFRFALEQFLRETLPDPDGVVAIL
jgi:hypothetical protein